MGRGQGWQIGNGSHAGGVYYDSPLRTGATAFAAHFFFIAERDMHHPALAAVHGVEAEIRARVLHFFGRRQSADPKLFNANGPIVVGIESNPRMIVGMHSQHFLRDQFQGEQQFGAIRQQHFHVFALKFDEEIGVFKLRIAGIAGLQPESQMKARAVDDLPEELLNPGASFVNRVLLRQARFLPSFDDVMDFFGAAAIARGPAVLLKNHCCAMPTKLLDSQYNTSPLDAGQKKKPYIRGMNCITFCCAGSPPAIGVIFCSRKLETIMTMGSTRIA
jgi:hypothetical protein